MKKEDHHTFKANQDLKVTLPKDDDDVDDDGNDGHGDNQGQNNGTMIEIDCCSPRAVVPLGIE